MQKKQLSIRLDAELYQKAKHKCKQKFGISLAPLIKMFLRAFVTQEGVGFYVGDQDLCRLYDQWLKKKKFEKSWGRRLTFDRPQLKDLFEMNVVKSQHATNIHPNYKKT